MAFQPGQVEVTLEVLAAPGAFLQADPLALSVAKGDMARYLLTVSPLEGYAGPFWLRCVNLNGECLSFTVNPIPPGGGQSIMEIDTNSDAWPVGPPERIGIEAWDVLPAEE